MGANAAPKFQSRFRTVLSHSRNNTDDRSVLEDGTVPLRQATLLANVAMNRSDGLANCNLPNFAEPHPPLPYDSEHRPENSLGNPRQRSVVLDRVIAIFDRFSEPHPYSTELRSFAPSTDDDIVWIGSNARLGRRWPNLRQFLEQHGVTSKEDDSPFSYRLVTASMLLQAARKEFLWQC